MYTQINYGFKSLYCVSYVTKPFTVGANTLEHDKHSEQWTCDWIAGFCIAVYYIHSTKPVQNKNQR